MRGRAKGQSKGEGESSISEQIILKKRRLCYVGLGVVERAETDSILLSAVHRLHVSAMLLPHFAGCKTENGMITDCQTDVYM